MTLKRKSMTPEQAELSITIVSGPRGSVRDDWPSIEYTVQLLRRRQIVWEGEYRLGVGHVKPMGWDELKTTSAFKIGLTQDEKYVSNGMKRGTQFKKEPRTLQLQADTAAKLAKAQKVTPKLDDVTHSLLSDGSAFFDGETFDDWCANFGYDADSRKAEATYRTCDEIGRKLARSLSRDELEALREWASNY
jgi:hypothetical protein